MTNQNNIHLRILLPTEILVDTTVTKVIAEAENGFFCLLPRHIDFVAALVPGVLFYYTADGKENYVAIDQGILVKSAADVSVSVFNAVQGADLEHLHELVHQKYIKLDEHERLARTALARLEAGTIRRFIAWQEEKYA